MRQYRGVYAPMQPQQKQGKQSEKILTVLVASYNGAATLPKALESCLVRNAERLDVIVVDDGSTDQTARIAGKYAEQWPETFRVIRQPNGGYGRALMTGLTNARGKYFRTLDCDDWFDTTALEEMLQYLETCVVDVVFSNYCTVREDRVQKVFEVCNGYDTRRIYTYDMLGQNMLDLEIHGMTCRTRMLRAAGIRLLSHCSYTDMAYTFMAMRAAQTMAFCPVLLYHYRLGRDGQSVSIESYQKHFEDYAKVAEQILYLADTLPGGSKGDLLRSRARDIAQYGIELLLRFAPEAKVRQRLEAYDRNLRKEHPNIARRMHNKNTFFLRTSRYMELGYRLANWHADRKTKQQKAKINKKEP